ncbi:MAG: transcription-repair coupling factor [bacterium]
MPETSIQTFLAALKNQTPSSITVSGLYGSADAYIITRLLQETYRVLVVCDTDDDAENLLNNIKTLFSLAHNDQACNGLLFLSDDVESRLSVLGMLSDRSKHINCIVCSKDAMSLPVNSITYISENCAEVVMGETIIRKDFIELLFRTGYERSDFVEEPGQCAIRGEVIDIWVPGEKNPYRILCPEASIEAIRIFDVGTQRSQKHILRAFIFPAHEKQDQHILQSLSSIWTDARIIFKCTETTEPDENLSGWICLENGSLTNPDYLFSCGSIIDFNKNLSLFKTALIKWKQLGFTVYVFSHNTGEMERLQELLYENMRELEDYPLHMIGTLTRGFVSPDEKIVCVSNGDIFGRYRRSFRLPRWTGGRVLHSIGEIARNDYVVHEKYGIGVYRGLEEMSAFDQTAEYLKIEYKGRDYLYVPVEDFKKVQKYIGGEGIKPKLYSLDGIAWESLTLKIKKGVIEFAQDLIKTQAMRIMQQGYAFSDLSHMEQEFADSFMYPETPDQTRTIEEVLIDMQSSRPMDRLVCGDVGFGKTEVAMRAAFKAVNDSCQVAMLAPTTILAEQHYNSFFERFADYPVRIGLLSRFQNKAEQQKILQQLKKGSIDIVIGTHRLLQKDVFFKNLKLFILDEEQRFGVHQKEKFKKQFAGIDILTLSATPIPRTLHMGLSGVKDLSLIETPPEGRQPIQTYVGPYQERLSVKAIESELSRGGQIFYVHNKVETIQSCLNRIKLLMPSIRIAYVHGQMKASLIEKNMLAFMHREIDVLVATSIIESGLDIPNVNTLIIENAQDMGLAQLYQLRGRIGRERQHAHCFLFYNPDIALTQESKKRLDALREFTALGSGFHLAMRDLEIRGAGNFLGDKQHGFMRDVGFNMYCRLLKQEIENQRHSDTGPVREVETTDGPKLDLKLNAYIPSAYIPNDAERIRLYRKALDCLDVNDVQQFEQELADRFGSLPVQVRTFMQFIELRQQAIALKIKSIIELKHAIEITFYPQHGLLPELVLKLAERYGTDIQFREQKEDFIIRVDEQVLGNNDWLGWIKNLVNTQLIC